MDEKIKEVLEKALTVLSAKLDKDDITIDDINKVVFIAKNAAQRDTSDIMAKYCALALEKFDEHNKPTATDDVPTTDETLI